MILDGHIKYDYRNLAIQNDFRPIFNSKSSIFLVDEHFLRIEIFCLDIIAIMVFHFKTSLNKKRILMDSWCVLCRLEYEHLQHLFRSCLTSCQSRLLRLLGIKTTRILLFLFLNGGRFLVLV